MRENLTDLLIDDLYGLTQETFPDSIVFQAQKCILDYLGVTFAGARMLEEEGNKFLDYFESEKGDAKVIGFSKKNTIQTAALINGISAHVAELDDGHRFGMMHPGAPIISALLSIAKKEKVKGKELLLGVIVGYEAALRIASAIQPSHKERGYHATGTCGPIGAAIGIAAMLHFTKAQMKDALSAAVTSASGILEVIDDGSELKPYNVGRAALDGLMAASVARAGFTGPNDVLGGKRGFFAVMSERNNLSYLEKQEASFAIERIYVKPYAACRHCHPAIEAVLTIRSKLSYLENIKDVKVNTYRLAVGGHDHTQIQGESSAKMSIPYSVAVALKFGRAGIEEYTAKCIANPDISSLTNKVKIYANEELTALVPQKRPAIVELITFDNICYTERVDFPKGEPENPISKEELEEKFISLAVYGGKSKKEANKIIKYVWDLEDGLYKMLNLL